MLHNNNTKMTCVELYHNQTFTIMIIIITEQTQAVILKDVLLFSH